MHFSTRQIFNAWLFSGTAAAASPTSKRNPCGSCTVFGQAKTSEWYKLKVKSTFTAFTVATVINTVTNSTRTTTIVNEAPASFTPPPANKGWTRVATATYVDHGKTLTTTVAFPTIFLDWNDTYGIKGSYPVAGGRCAKGKTIDIQKNPQPQDDRRLQTIDANDPFGWGYELRDSGFFGAVTLNHWEDILPEYPDGFLLINGSVCDSTGAAPHNDKFDASWLVVAASTTILEGNKKTSKVDPVKAKPTATSQLSSEVSKAGHSSPASPAAHKNPTTPVIETASATSSPGEDTNSDASTAEPTLPGIGNGNGNIESSTTPTSTPPPRFGSLAMRKASFPRGLGAVSLILAVDMALMWL